MDENDFWTSLEYRLYGEFAGMKDPALRHLWCDGFIPQQYLLHVSEPRITGTAWICNGRSQDKWKFTLILPEPVGSRDEIDWASLLPAENVPRWLALDQPGKHIQIEPAAGTSDPT